DPETRRIGVIVDALAQQLVHLSFLRARIAEDAKLRAVRIGWLAADQQPVYIDGCRPQRIGERGGEPCHLLPIQDVDVGISGEQPGIDGKEETAWLKLVIFNRAIDSLQHVIADGKDSVSHDVSLLLRDDAAKLDSLTEVGDRLDAVVAARDRGSDEA